MDGGRGPTTASTTEILDGLNDLLQLDHDAIGAYEIAIEKLEDRDHASQISGFKRDHERHIQSLNELITQLGGTPKNAPHATGPLKQAMQSIGALGGDKGTLVAWRTNELQVRTKYDGYASKAVFWTHDVKRLIDENALDEERHYDWVSGVLERMGVPTTEGVELGVTNQVRERIGQVQGIAQSAREHVGDLTENVRARTSEGVASANERADELRRNVEAEVRANPLRSVFGVFAIGFVIGRILR